VETGYYRRPLPQDLVAFSSEEGRALFREALAAGGMEGYFRLSEQLHTQADPAFCGLSTLVVVLNALAVDPGRIWKGGWRWFGEEMLDCCVPLEQVRAKGITFGQLSCLARCNGAAVDARRGGEHDLASFRADVIDASSRSDGPIVVAAYDRGGLDQTGAGHYSPIGGYHAGRDLALVLDVARFKYPPHWVSLPRLFEAMQRTDPDTGKSRGWYRVQRSDAPPAVHFLVSCKEVPWEEVSRHVFDQIAGALASGKPSTAAGAIETTLRAVAWGAVARAVGTYPSGADSPPAHRAAVEALLGQLRATPLYAETARTIAAGGLPLDPELAAVIMFALPDEVFAALSREVRAELGALRDPPREAKLLGDEMARVRQQVGLIRELSAEQGAPG
jgi:glutathione gamma-glutamylcysteinyltransferase